MFCSGSFSVTRTTSNPVVEKPAPLPAGGWRGPVPVHRSGACAGLALAMLSTLLAAQPVHAGSVYVTPTQVTVREGSTATYTVKLEGQESQKPSAPVTVTPTVTGDPDISVSGALTFTPGNWNTAQTVTVRAAEDTDFINGKATISHTSASADGSYNSDRILNGNRIRIDRVHIAGIASVTATERDNNLMPTGLTAEPADRSIFLTWEHPMDAMVTGWEVRYRVDGAAEWGDWELIEGSSATTRSHTVSGLSNNTNYEIQVRFTSADGPGEASASVSAAPKSGTPPPPQNLAATAGSGPGEVELSWENLPSSAYRNKWEVRRKEGAGTWGNWTRVGTRSTDGRTAGRTARTSHTVRRLTASAIHSFQVRQVSFTLEQVQFGIPRELNEAPGPASNTATVLLMVSATVSTESLSVPEGGMDTYTVVLGVQPTGPVTVTPTATGYRRISVSAALTFMTDNWSTPQTVTVSAEQTSTSSATWRPIAHLARGGDFDSVSIASVTVTAVDDEAPTGLTATPTYDAVLLTWAHPVHAGLPVGRFASRLSASRGAPGRTFRAAARRPAPTP